MKKTLIATILLTATLALMAQTSGNMGLANVILNLGGVLRWGTDTGLSRDSAGVVDIGNGTAGNKSGTLNLASILATSTITGSVVQGTGVSTTAQGTATSGGNFNSGAESFIGSYWNGSAAAMDTWTWGDTLGAGTNPTSTAVLAHSGSPGAVSVVIPTVTLSAPIGTSTCAANTGGGVTSCAARGGYPAPTNTRGDLTIVGGTATTGLIATVSFSSTLSAAPSCSVVQEGGTALFGIDVGAPSTSSFTISAGVSVLGATLNIHYNCVP